MGLSLLSVWARPKLWVALLGASLFLAMSQGLLGLSGLIVVVAWAYLWRLYTEETVGVLHWILFGLIVLGSFGFKFHLFPGFEPVRFSGSFRMGIDAPIVGLFPLALVCSLASSKRDWREALWGGFKYSAVGIGALIVLALIVGVVKWSPKLPTHFEWRYLSNLVLTAIPEEAFYRGFLQERLTRCLPATGLGKSLAVVLAAAVFTLAHLYWAPGFVVLAFVFVAGLLYGFVYMATKKLESAILCHFLLNAVHMTLFSYHAM